MKRITFIVLIICTLPVTQLMSQNDTINQIDSKGRRYGYWRHYYENGKASKEGNYLILNLQVSPEKLFMEGTSKSDSFAFQSVKNGEWKYYNEKEELDRSEKWDLGNIVWMDEYIYEEGKEVEKIRLDLRNSGKMNRYYGNTNILISFDPHKIKLTGRVGDYIKRYLTISSILNEKINITNKTSSDDIKILKSDFNINPKESLEIPFMIKFREGENFDRLEFNYLISDSITRNVLVERFGFNLSTNDFHEFNEKILTFDIKNNNIYFFRALEYCELKIYPFNKNDFDKIKIYEIKELKVIPLSVEYNEIDISFLNKGKYLFRIVNYRDNIDLFAIVNRI